MNKSADGKYIAGVFMWAWKAGVDVSLRSKSYEVPLSKFKMPRTKADYPVLRFSRGDNHVEYMGRDFNDLIKQTKYMINKVSIELLCPPFGDL